MTKPLLYVIINTSNTEGNNQMEKVLLSTKLERLMNKTRRTRESLAHGKYSNGVYSKSSGDWAQIEMENIETNEDDTGC